MTQDSTKPFPPKGALDEKMRMELRNVMDCVGEDVFLKLSTELFAERLSEALTEFPLNEKWVAILMTSYAHLRRAYRAHIPESQS